MRDDASGAIFAEISGSPLLTDRKKPAAAPAPAIKTIMKRKRKIFFTVEDFSLCCLRISEFLMKAGAPLINQCISHIKIFTQNMNG